MNLLNLFDIVDAVAAQKQSEQPTDNVVDVPATVQASQANGQPATIVVPVAAASEVEVLEDDHEDSLNIGDEVIIAGNVQYQGKTGRVVDFGRNKHFVIVDLYNFGKHSFHSSNVEHNDYADSEEEDADWRERDHGLFGDDERDEVNEDNGGYYYEILARKVFDERPNFSTSGRAEELVDYAFRFAVQDLGKSRARWEFGYDEDFLSDFVSAYGELQRGEQGVAEGSSNVRYKAHPTKKTHIVVTQVPAGHKGIKVGDEIARSDIKGWKGFSAERKNKVVAEGKAVYYHVVDHNNKSIKAFMYSQDAIKFVNDRRKKDPTANKWKVVAKKNAVIGEQGVAEGEYDDPRWEPREPDMSRKVDWDIEAERNAPEEKSEPTTVTVKDADGKVVLTFPSTGGFYGDKRLAASKGFDTETGDYTMKWKRDTNEGNNWLDTPVSEEFDRIKKLAGLK